MDILFLLNISPRKKERKGIGREKRERDGGKKGGGGERERIKSKLLYISQLFIEQMCLLFYL